ncbi:hypothetical protein ACRXB1_28440, partial [Caballeronia sp. M23-90]
SPNGLVAGASDLNQTAFAQYPRRSPYRGPPPVVYAPPPPVYAQPAIVIGWHGDRYYDGRRYWARDDWYRHHGGGPRYGDRRGY